MKVVTDKVYKRVHRYKDDNLVIKNNYLYGVINGLPFLHTKEKNLNYTVSFINDIKSALNKYDGHSRLANYLYDLSEKEFIKFKNVNELGKSYYPSCGLSICYFQDDYAELYTLGECYIVYETKDGTKGIIYSEELEELNNSELQEALEIAKKNKFSMKKSINRIHDTLIKNRELLNSNMFLEMYTIAKHPQFRFNHRRIKISSLKYIYLFSDGFARAFTTLKLYGNYEEMFSSSLDIHQVEEAIIKASESDKRLKKYPRINYKEDISCIKLLFE